MINKNPSSVMTALCLTICLLTTHSMASSGKAREALPDFSGELSAKGTVSVNDMNAIDGTTVFPDSALATSADSNAMVGLGNLGRVELLSGSSLNLGFDETSVTGLLHRGSVRVFVPAGVSATIMTKDGSVVTVKDEGAAYTVSVEEGNTLASVDAGRAELRAGDRVTPIGPGESASAGKPGRAQGGGIGNNLSGGQKAALAVGIGIAAALIIYFIVDDDDDDIIPIISPTK